MHGSSERHRRAEAPANAVTQYEPGGGSSGRAGRASQRIVDQLRVRIHEGHLSQGDRLPPERELCERYGVSRVTVREALRVLEAGGLIDIRLGSHGGAFVTAPTAERVAGGIEDYLALSGTTPRKLHEARLALEPSIVELACQQSGSDDIDPLTRNCDELARARQVGHFDYRSAGEFHLLLGRASGNPVLEVLLRPLYERVPQESGRGHETDAATERTIKEHRELVEALRARDAPRAAQAMRDHLERMRPAS